MNIFVLDKDPKIAAKYHCDKHVVKMILETVQILSTVRHLYGLDAPYKPTHTKHPCVLWASNAKENYEWLIELGVSLLQEYQKRYKKSDHKCIEPLNWLEANKNQIPFKEEGLTAFVQTMPEEYRIENDPIEAYKNFYIGEKSYFAVWKYSETPEWFSEGIKKVN